MGARGKEEAVESRDTSKEKEDEKTNWNWKYIEAKDNSEMTFLIPMLSSDKW